VFLTNAPAQLARIREAVERREATETARLAHTLRGSTAIFAADDVVSALRSLEAAAKKEAWDELEGHLAELSVKFDRLVGLLNAIVAS
jgi:HPt (histidine-containing phosphotransfer) domain-containing protein